jgi:hypothetical protein
VFYKLYSRYLYTKMCVYECVHILYIFYHAKFQYRALNAAIVATISDFTHRRYVGISDIRELKSTKVG